MITRYRVALDGNHLDQIDEAIIIKDIQEQPPQISMNTLPSGRRVGTIITKTSRDAMNVTVTLEVNEYDVNRRAEIIEQVINWAKNGGYMTVGYRENQRILVSCTKYPSVASALKWTDNLSIEFSAYMNPYWENISEDVYDSSRIASGSGAFVLSGNGNNAIVSASVVSGGALKTLTLRVGSTKLVFEGLNISNGNSLTIGYDSNGVQYIRSGTTSKLSCRKIESDDDLLANAGNNSVSFVADVPVTVRLTARGLYE